MTIQNTTNILEDFKGANICVSVRFVWENTDLAPHAQRGAFKREYNSNSGEPPLIASSLNCEMLLVHSIKKLEVTRRIFRGKFPKYIHK